MCSRSQRVSPQRSVSLNLDDIQGIEVGDEQVGLSVGCTRGHYREDYSDDKTCCCYSAFNRAALYELQSVFTKGQRQTAPLDFLSAAPATVRVHKHSELCDKNNKAHYTLCALYCV